MHMYIYIYIFIYGCLFNRISGGPLASKIWIPLLSGCCFMPRSNLLLLSRRIAAKWQRCKALSLTLGFKRREREYSRGKTCTTS